MGGILEAAERFMVRRKNRGRGAAQAGCMLTKVRGKGGENRESTVQGNKKATANRVARW